MAKKKKSSRKCKVVRIKGSTRKMCLKNGRMQFVKKGR